jgi:hypothetical protein
MLDVLIYLFENYYAPESCPDSDTLARKLAAVGFENEEIDEALDWLSGLSHAVSTPAQHAVTRNGSAWARRPLVCSAFLTVLGYCRSNNVNWLLSERLLSMKTLFPLRL